MGEGAGGPRSGRGRGGGRGEVHRPEGRGGAGGREGGEGRGEGRGREGAGGERSSRVTSPTRRRGHRRRRRHFNRAFGLRSALSVRAKEPPRSASRSHSSASRPLFASLPPTSPSAHTPHAPHPAVAGSQPSLSSSVRPPRPRSTPRARSPTPPSPDLCQRPEGRREASAAAGGVRVSRRRWRRLRAGRDCAASPTAAHSAGSEAPRASWVTRAALSPAPELRHFPSGPAKGSGCRFHPCLPPPRCVVGGWGGSGPTPQPRMGRSALSPPGWERVERPGSA